MSQVYISQVLLMANTFTPRGWHACDGSLIAISQNQALFALIGTTYGGDGISNFALPDLRSRVPVGTGQGPGLSNYVLGQKGGSEQVTLQASNVAPHTHAGTFQVTDNQGRTPLPVVLPANGNYLVTTTTVAPSSPPLAALAGVSVQPNSGGTPFSVLQPYLALNYCIALQGLFPSRS